MFCLIRRNRNQKSNIMRRQRNEFQTKEQNKTPEQTLMKWSLDKCLPDIEFKEMIKGGSPNSENEWRNSVRNINRDRKYKKEATKLNIITEILKYICVNIYICACIYIHLFLGVSSKRSCRSS